MPRRSRELTQATSRAAERAVAGQRLLVETLKASGKPWLDAEDLLQMCISALKVLEGHERIEEGSLRCSPAWEAPGNVGIDPFSGKGLDILDALWEPWVNKFRMSPPLVICCVRQNHSVSVSVMRLNGLGDHEVDSPTR
jgi:hypothetical protein